MIIRALTENDILRALDIFKASYKDMAVPDYEERCFSEELHASFDPKQVYTIEFFGIEIDDNLVSFAGLANSNYYEQSWELRWGTTHPDYQRQGLMGKLIQYRIDTVIERAKKMPGIIHVAARSPHIYLKHDFEPLFTRGPYNQSTYMVKCFNQEFDYKVE